MMVLGTRRDLESFLEPFCVDLAEYELISTRLDSFQPQLINLGKLDYLGSIWEASGRRLGGIWEASGKHLGAIWEPSGRHLGGIFLMKLHEHQCGPRR